MSEPMPGVGEVYDTYDRPWWLRLRFVEGGWELVGQTMSEQVMRRWDDEIDAREERSGIDHEWIVGLPYGARRLTYSDEAQA
jgi:hypothetical protein